MTGRRQHITAALLVLGGLVACSPADRPAVERTFSVAPIAPSTAGHESAEQVSTYIRCIFQDRDRNFWYGTTTDGVTRYDGNSLTYFNSRNGFGSDWVNAIQQDAEGDLWFATRDGVVRYDGTRFTRYTTKDGLASDHVWSMLLDRDGGWWFGTYEGVSHFDGRTFTPFAIPAADLSKHPYYEDPRLINAIVQDRAGDIWFATKGGAYRYSGSRLTRFGEPDGLCSDLVNTIQQARDGRLLFGTRFGGLCSFNGHGLEPMLRDELKSDNVGVLYEDSNGVLWVGLTAVGLCAYDHEQLTCYNEREGAGIRVVFCMLEDDQGRMWVGTGAGVYRHEGGRFINVTKDLLTGG